MTDTRAHAREPKDWGVIEPGPQGRYSWPLNRMEPGDWLHVDHADMAPGRLGHYMTVRASQLGKRFSTQGHDPDKPGFARVTCVEWDARPVAQRKLDKCLDYGDAKRGLLDWYGINIERLPVAPLFNWKEVEMKVAQRNAPPSEQVVFELPPMTIGATCYMQSIVFVRLPDGATLDMWKRHKDVWDFELEMRQDEAKRDEEVKLAKLAAQTDRRPLLTSFCKDEPPSLQDLMS